jgi:Cu/Ag efflux protein CusF
MFNARALLGVLLSFLMFVASSHAQDSYSYTVKGVIKALPGNGRAVNELIVKHEAIPNYRDEAGNVVGMMAMTMPFYLAESVSASGLAVGDNIELTVEQKLKPKFSEQVVVLKKLEGAR